MCVCVCVFARMDLKMQGRGSRSFISAQGCTYVRSYLGVFVCTLPIVDSSHTLLNFVNGFCTPFLRYFICVFESVLTFV